MPQQKKKEHKTIYNKIDSLKLSNVNYANLYNTMPCFYRLEVLKFLYPSSFQYMLMSYQEESNFSNS